MTSVAERALGWPGRVLVAVLLVPGVITVLIDPLQGLYFFAYGLVAAVLIVRRPTNAIGPIVLVLGYGFLVTSMPIDQVDPTAARTGGLTLVESVIVWINAWGGSASFTAYLALALLFPTGRFPDGRWRRPAMAALAVAIGLTVLIAFAPTVEFNPAMGATPEEVPNPFAVLPGSPLWSIIPSAAPAIAIIGLLIVGVASMVVRYRRASGILRLQLRWLVAALAIVVSAIVFGLTILYVFDAAAGFLGWLPALVAFVTVPIAIGIAILRYRLYEIDRIISRTLSYAIISAALATVFVGGVISFQAALQPFTTGNTVAVAASTLIVAALFQPLRRRVQRVVDRRFDRTRYDGQRLAEAFARELRDEVDLERLRAALLVTTDEAVRPSGSWVWLRGGNGGAP